MNIKYQYSLKAHNTFGIDVNAKTFIQIENIADLDEALAYINKANEEILVLGSGSNILFTKNVEHVVLSIETNTIELIEETNDSVIIKVAAGVVWDDFVQYAVDNEYYGTENLSHIPGKAGSGAVQNIGAYGVEVMDIIDNVFLVNRKNGMKTVFSAKDCQFDYRKSIFKEEAKDTYIITYVSFKLSKQKQLNLSYKELKKYLKKKNILKPNITDVRNAIIEIRQAKLPDHNITGNAGSFFKNPIVNKTKFLELKKKYADIIFYPTNDNAYKLAAGWLIDKAGWKGKRQGNAGVHEKQALVLINHGGASGKEIFELSENIQKDIINKFGILLSREVLVM